MPLILPTLQKPLEALFVKGTGASPESAEIMSSAYVAYVSTALFGASIPIFTGAEKELMKVALLLAMNSFIPNPAGLGLQWAAAINTFWLSPPINCVGAAPGPVQAVPGTASLPAAMLAVTSIPFQPAAVAAAGIAACIDAATKTAIANLNVSGTPTPTPII